MIYKPKFLRNQNKKLLFDTTNTKLNIADTILEEVKIINQMYNYKNTSFSTDTSFKANCVKIWSSLPFDYKTLAYSLNKTSLFEIIKARKP